MGYNKAIINFWHSENAFSLESLSKMALLAIPDSEAILKMFIALKQDSIDK
jgi:hypothetical protein